jgi:hypothetical protein
MPTNAIKILEGVKDNSPQDIYKSQLYNIINLCADAADVVSERKATASKSEG